MDKAMDPGVHGNRDDGAKRTPSSDRATPPPWQHQLRRLAEAPVRERTLGRRTNGKETEPLRGRASWRSQCQPANGRQVGWLGGKETKRRGALRATGKQKMALGRRTNVKTGPVPIFPCPSAAGFCGFRSCPVAGSGPPGKSPPKPIRRQGTCNHRGWPAHWQ